MMATLNPQPTVPVAADKRVVQTGDDFIDGMCSGYLDYCFEYENRPLTDQDIYTILHQNITNSEGTDTFNAGYCTGWIEGLLEHRNPLE
jgi:hypothetical protein